jgi:glucosamine 6-phosphate synthetase-like amidotransferase/phosphosugar isomerase protein
MCGIAGFNIADGDMESLNSRTLARELLLQIQSRGRDATGASWCQRDKDTGKMEVWYSKRKGPATQFVPTLRNIPVKSRNVILHTRYATQGDPENNDNNHPIVVPGITGVHNGHISNDDEIIRDFGGERTGQVDSEAAFRLIAESPNFLTDLPRLKGRAALAWIGTGSPRTLHLARLTGSPLFIGQTHAGSTIFASTRELLATACFRAGTKLEMMEEVDEWTYIRITAGVIHEWQPMQAPAQPRLFDFAAQLDARMFR